MELKTTPLLDEHKRLNAKLAPFGGWLMPIQYEGIIAEHNWTRTQSTLFDICHMGEFMISGSPEKTGLDRILTINLSSMSDGSCHYGFMLADNGGILDDVIIYKISDDEWMLVVNAATTPTDLAHLKKNLKDPGAIKDISSDTGKLDLQGPRSRDVLKKLAGQDISRLKYYHFGKFTIAGKDVLISRTGYTGELGYEIYAPSDNMAELWNLILDDKNAKPAGLGARDTLRLEMCYPLYGQDIDISVNPIEAGLDRFVDLSKDFIGKSALLTAKKNAAGKRLICLSTGSRRSPRHEFDIFYDGENVGKVTSGSFSPSLSVGIGMGYINTERVGAGREVTLSGNNISLTASISDKPLYKNGTARKD